MSRKFPRIGHDSTEEKIIDNLACGGLNWDVFNTISSSIIETEFSKCTRPLFSSSHLLKQPPSPYLRNSFFGLSNLPPTYLLLLTSREGNSRWQFIIVNELVQLEAVGKPDLTQPEVVDPESAFLPAVYKSQLLSYIGGCNKGYRRKLGSLLDASR